MTTIYRKCECGETAHDYKYQTAQELKADAGRGVWACRNCGKLALTRARKIKVRPGFPRRDRRRGGADGGDGVGGDDPSTDKG